MLVEDDAGARGILEAHALETYGRRRRAGRRDVAPARAFGRQVEKREDPVRDRRSVGARVVLRSESTEREIELRRKHEYREPGLERKTSVVESDTDRDRDKRDAERCRELEHGSR